MKRIGSDRLVSIVLVLPAILHFVAPCPQFCCGPIAFLFPAHSQQLMEGATRPGGVSECCELGRTPRENSPENCPESCPSRRNDVAGLAGESAAFDFSGDWVACSVPPLSDRIEYRGCNQLQAAVAALVSDHGEVRISCHIFRI